MVHLTPLEISLLKMLAFSRNIEVLTFRTLERPLLAAYSTSSTNFQGQQGNTT